MVSIAVAITGGGVGTSTIVDRSRPVADATGIQRTDTVVHIVADTVVVRIGSAVASAYTDCVKLVAIAVTVSVRDFRAAAFVDGTRAVADATGVIVAHAVVHVIANAIRIHIGRAVAAADAQGVELVAIAVAIAVGNAAAAADAAFVELVAIAITVTGRNAVSTTDPTCIERQAGAIIVCGCSVEVAGRLIRAAGHLLLVTDLVVVDVVDAVSVAVHEVGLRINTRRIRSIARAIAANRQIQGQVILIVTGGEHLDVQGSAQLTTRGELAEQYRSIRVRETVDISVQHIPYPTDDVIDDDVAARLARARIEYGCPIQIGAIDDGRRALTVIGVCRAIQSNGDPTVICQIRVGRQQQRVDILRSGTTQNVLEEVGRRRDVQRLNTVAIHRSHEISWVLCMQQNAVSRLAGEVSCGVLLDGPQLQTISCVHVRW